MSRLFGEYWILLLVVAFALMLTTFAVLFVALSWLLRLLLAAIDYLGVVVMFTLSLDLLDTLTRKR